MKTDCVPFTGYKDKDGYGIRKIKGRVRRAHRLAYAKHHSLDELSMGGEVMHTCDNPSCVNPLHLELGTHAENMADMASKDRGTKLKQCGEDNGAAVLTDTDVLYIRKCGVKGWPSKGGNVTALANKFHVSRQQIHNILDGKLRIDKFVEDVT